MKLLTVLLGAAALGVPAVASAASYLPTGPQTNVNIATVLGGGWSLCYSATMGASFGSSASTTLAGCSGSRLLLAGRETGSSNLLALAQTTKVDALFNTGAGNNNVFHASDGSDWFNADNYSWGFKPIGAPFAKTQCSFNPPNGSMCIHTLNGVGGFSINTITGLNGSQAYEKLVFTGNGMGAVPEPSAWGLMILGFGVAGATMRRRRMSASFAQA